MSTACLPWASHDLRRCTNPGVWSNRTLPAEVCQGTLWNSSGDADSSTSTDAGRGTFTWECLTAHIRSYVALCQVLQPSERGKWFDSKLKIFHLEYSSPSTFQPCICERAGAIATLDPYPTRNHGMHGNFDNCAQTKLPLNDPASFNFLLAAHDAIEKCTKLINFGVIRLTSDRRTPRLVQ